MKDYESILESLHENFGEKNYTEVVKLISIHRSVLPDLICSNDDAGFFALAAFSFFKVEEYERSLFYSLRLIKYIKAQNHTAANGLLEDLILISFISYVRRHKNIRAYLLVRKHRKRSDPLASDVVSGYESVKNSIAFSIVGAVNSLLLWGSLLLCLVQELFKPFSIAVYFPSLLLLLLYFGTTLLRPGIFLKFVRSRL